MRKTNSVLQDVVNMKKHLERKMKSDGELFETYTDDELVRFLETCYGFESSFTQNVVQQWRKNK